MTEDFDITKQTHFYEEKLHQLLEETQHQLKTFPLSLEKISDEAEKERIESWILSLNTWYYHQFHETFFPFYQKEISQELRSSFHLYQDQSTLEQNIIFVYKYYAQMYNHLTQILSRIGKFETYLHQFCMKTQNSAFKQTLKLYNQMQDLEQKLSLLEESLVHLSTWAQKVEVRLAFKQFPGHFSILPAVRSYLPDDRKCTRFLKELQLHIQLQLDLLQTLRQTPAENHSTALNTLQAMKEETQNHLPEKKIPLEMRHWYKQYFCSQQQMYLQNIEINIQSKTPGSMDSSTAERYESWLSSLLTIIKELWLPPASGTDFSLQEVIQYAMPAYNPSQDQKALKTLIHTVRGFLKTIQPGSHPDSSVLLEGANPILVQVRDFIQQLLQQALLGNGVSLLHPLQETNYILSTVEFTFDEIMESTEVHRSLLEQLSHLSSISQQYKQSFEELRTVLNRKLQTRQAERSLKNFTLKIDRWTLNKPSELPPDCLACMAEKNIHPLSPAVLEKTEGDLFLLQIGSQCECIIPHLAMQEEQNL